MLSTPPGCSWLGPGGSERQPGLGLALKDGRRAPRVVGNCGAWSVMFTGRSVEEQTSQGSRYGLETRTPDTALGKQPQHHSGA